MTESTCSCCTPKESTKSENTKADQQKDASRNNA